jgi:hypothetical protein
MTSSAQTRSNWPWNRPRSASTGGSKIAVSARLEKRYLPPFRLGSRPETWNSASTEQVRNMTQRRQLAGDLRGRPRQPVDRALIQRGVSRQRMFTLSRLR